MCRELVSLPSCCALAQVDRSSLVADASPSPVVSALDQITNFYGSKPTRWAQGGAPEPAAEPEPAAADGSACTVTSRTPKAERGLNISIPIPPRGLNISAPPARPDNPSIAMRGTTEGVDAAAVADPIKRPGLLT